ncbi:MAG: hypothetical protein ACJ8C4_21180 [Gemmataceae bacterium]
MWEDPIVAEVHRIREQIAAECNYDLDEFLASLREEQDRYSDRLVRLDETAEPTAEAGRGRSAGASGDTPESAPAA